MKSIRTAAVVAASAIPVLAAVVACSPAGKEDAGTGVSDTSLSGMPGMPGTKAAPPEPGSPSSDTSVSRASRRIVFSAAQVLKGALQWEQAMVGATTASATIPGQIVANEDRTARLGAPASGRVVTVLVRPGDRVARDAALVVMQSPEAGAAQADVAKSEAELASGRAEATYAKSAKERAQRLLDLKSIPRQDYERAVADDELARATLAQAEAELARARSTARQLGASGSSPGELVLRSPLAGVVLQRLAIPGSVVEAGAPLVVVTDPSRLWLIIDAPEALSNGFRVGSRARFTVAGNPMDTLIARIDAVGAGLDPERRTLPVRAAVDNAPGRLRPEMLATVLVDAERGIPAVMLPDDAVQLLDGQPVVFIAMPDDRGGATFSARPVVVGARMTGRVAVTGGLSSGELVVVRGAFNVKAEMTKGSMREMGM